MDRRVRAMFLVHQRIVQRAEEQRAAEAQHVRRPQDDPQRRDHAIRDAQVLAGEGAEDRQKLADEAV